MIRIFVLYSFPHLQSFVYILQSVVVFILDRLGYFKVSCNKSSKDEHNLEQNV